MSTSFVCYSKWRVLMCLYAACAQERRLPCRRQIPPLFSGHEGPARQPGPNALALNCDLSPTESPYILEIGQRWPGPLAMGSAGLWPYAMASSDAHMWTLPVPVRTSPLALAKGARHRPRSSGLSQNAMPQRWLRCIMARCEVFLNAFHRRILMRRHQHSCAAYL